MIKLLYCFYFVLGIHICTCRVGPDPWDLVNDKSITNEDDLPPDLKISKNVNVKVESSQSMSDWFYRRLLAIILKGSHRKENEDSSIDISLQMKYNQDKFNILNDYIKSNDALSEEMFRRSIGIIEEAIYKPTITETIIMAWNDYFYIYFVEYKDYLTWGFGILALIASIFVLWQYISYKHILILLGISLYLYEAFISYKEAEKEEVRLFLSAVNSCKWYFWTSQCEVTPPDPLIMLKHMNPLKIGIRMFTTVISEPMITISATVNTMLNGITADLMYPFNKIVQGVLVLFFNALLIMLLVSIIFNFILNIPFQLNFLYIFSVVLPKRYRSATVPKEQPQVAQGDRISAETLNKFLDVCSKALNVTQVNNIGNNKLAIASSSNSSMRRSASAGRLSDLSNLTNNNMHIEYNKNITKRKHNGSGDS